MVHIKMIRRQNERREGRGRWAGIAGRGDEEGEETARISEISQGSEIEGEQKGEEDSGREIKHSLCKRIV